MKRHIVTWNKVHKLTKGSFARQNEMINVNNIKLIFMFFVKLSMIRFNKTIFVFDDLLS